MRAPPRARTCELADPEGVSEAELLASSVGDTVTRLAATSLATLIRALPELGACMAVTRNGHAISEVVGQYRAVELGRHVGAIAGDRVGLRLWPAHWQLAYAVDEPGERVGEGRRRSLQFFDGAGAAVHKVYLRPDGSLPVWRALVARFADEDQRPGEALGEPVTAPIRRRERRDRDLDRARRVTDDALVSVLWDAAERGVELQIVVGNRGCHQGYTGPLQRVGRAGPWLSVVDLGFTLRVREDHIASTWVVRTPGLDGAVTSLEIHDGAGELIASVAAAGGDDDDDAAIDGAAWAGLLDRLAGSAPVIAARDRDQRLEPSSAGLALVACLLVAVLIACAATVA